MGVTQRSLVFVVLVLPAIQADWIFEAEVDFLPKDLGFHILGSIA